jgi:hypothetical protein
MAKIDKHVWSKASIFLPVEYYSAARTSDKCASPRRDAKNQNCSKLRPCLAAHGARQFQPRSQALRPDRLPEPSGVHYDRGQTCPRLDDS